MALAPITLKQSESIAKNIAECIKKSNMGLLSSTAYKFISLRCGFIAHYNLQGFKDYYSSNISEFRDDILNNKSINCRLNHDDYSKSVANTYKLICDKIENS